MAKQRHKSGKDLDREFLTTKSSEPHWVARESWRVFRIMGEFVEGFESLADVGPAVTVFGSARMRPDDGKGWYEKSTEMAYHLGKAGFAVLTGGGPGIMEAANKGAHEADALSVGLNIVLPFEQHINPYVDIAVDFDYFFIRKTMLVKYSKAFVVLPGGFGTMDELFEALTLIQTGKIENFPVVLVGKSYWGGLIDWLKNSMQQEGMISPEDLNLIMVTDSAEEACQFILSCTNENPDRSQAEADARAVTQRIVGK